MAQRRRRLLRQIDQAAPQARRLQRHRRPPGRHQSIPRRDQRQPKALHLDRRSRRHHRKSQARETGVGVNPLAYEIPTACGFHIFRATESVLRKYYSHSTGGSPPPKVRNIGVYVRMLRAQNCGDEIVLATLQQLARLHRNPLIHPEAVLTMDEAIATLGIARSVVTAMLKILPVVLPTTGAA